MENLDENRDEIRKEFSICYSEIKKLTRQLAEEKNPRFLDAHALMLQMREFSLWFVTVAS